MSLKSKTLANGPKVFVPVHAKTENYLTEVLQSRILKQLYTLFVTEGWTDRRMDRQKNGQTEGWTQKDGQTEGKSHLLGHKLLLCPKYEEDGKLSLIKA